jgi:hypothetical protein
MIELKTGKCYLIKYKMFPERKNAKVYEMRAQILASKVFYGVREYVTNHRPWGEGGTGTLRQENIVDATEIERGPVPR